MVKQYRMVLYDQESLSQSRHLLFKPVFAILIALATFVGIAAGTWALIYMVPAFHQDIPGFESHLSEDYMSLQRKNQDLEREVAEMDSMLKVFTQVMGAGAKPQENPKVWDSGMPEPANPSFPDSESDGQQGQTPATQEPASAVPASPTQPASASPTKVPTSRRGPVILNLVPPIDGYVTKDFEPKDKPHFGIDLAAEENAMVRAVADGVVIFSEYSNTTGHVLGIWHSQSNLISFYKHNSRTFKTVGAFVFAGEAIAVIGNTGINSSGTHLHFELWYDNNPVNPADYINFN
jgi:murein DD-endopeptidase MepM/ murein hydrolase activator NlpD